MGILQWMKFISILLRQTFGMTSKSKKERNLYADIDTLRLLLTQRCTYLEVLIQSRHDLMIFTHSTLKNDFGRRKFALEIDQKLERFTEQLLLET